jgi:hypothetical protein
VEEIRLEVIDREGESEERLSKSPITNACVNWFARTSSAKNDISNYCALSFIGGQVSAKQVNKIGGEVVPQERSHELQRSLII